MIRNLVKPVVVHPSKGSGHAMSVIIPAISQSLQANKRPLMVQFNEEEEWFKIVQSNEEEE